MSKIFCILNVDLQGEEFLRICLGEEEFLRNWCRIFSTPMLGVEIFLSKFILSKKLHHALSKIFCRGKKPVSKKFCRNSGVLPKYRPISKSPRHIHSSIQLGPYNNHKPKKLEFLDVFHVQPQGKDSRFGAQISMGR